MVRENTDYEDCFDYHQHNLYRYYHHDDNIRNLSFLHVLPKLLWRICSKRELWSQRNRRCYVLTARNNRRIVTIRDVTRTAVAMEQFSKHVSAERNSRNNRTDVFCVVRAATIAMQRKGNTPPQHSRDCFLCR
jgi:hypothetical protein